MPQLGRMMEDTGIVLTALIVLVPFLSLTWLSLSQRWSSKLNKPRTPASRPVKIVAQSSVSYSCKISPEYCDEHGRVFGGELLKLIDVSAGVVAAKHAGGPCLTISVDRVIFLSEIRVGDIVHLSSAVNRAWGSSMEIGVRVMRETAAQPKQKYCCHAYLTFVAKATEPLPLSIIANLCVKAGLTKAPVSIRAQVAALKPVSSLESKRYLLAGRRRARRVQGRDRNDALLQSFRKQVMAIEAALKENETRAESDTDKERVLLDLQKEMLTDAYMRKDPDLKIEGEWVIVEIEGFMDPVRMKLTEIEQAINKKGRGGYRRLTVPSSEDIPSQTDYIKQQEVKDGRERENMSVLDLADTLVMCMWIVRPQHCNSKNILFGGTLMRWVEEAAAISARRISGAASWSSASIDSLTFKSAVQPGEAVYVRACTLKVWDSSVEVAIIVLAEDRNSPEPKVRLVSESFFSLVAIEAISGRPMKGGLRQVCVPIGPAAAMASMSSQRRAERLLDKGILQKVYA